MKQIILEVKKLNSFDFDGFILLPKQKNETPLKIRDSTNILTALALAAIQAGHAAVHKHHRLGAAFGAKHRFIGKAIVAAFPMLGFKFTAFFGKKFLLMVAHFLRLDHADVFQVRLDRITDFCHQRRHEDTAFLEITTARIEHRFHLLYKKTGVAAFAEHCRNYAG